MIDSILKFIHKAQLIRRAIIIWALIMSTYITVEMLDWVKSSKDISMALAAVVAAIISPVLALTGHLLKTYASNPYVQPDKRSDKDEKGDK